MDLTRRKLLKQSSLAAAAIAAPHLWLPTAREAWGATLKKGEPIKVGLLFSLT
ncbi:twin-arginine translocation signal domain-containing protein, partial [Pseudomonas aeruginosa]